MRRFDLVCQSCSYGFSVFLVNPADGACPRCAGRDLQPKDSAHTPAAAPAPERAAPVAPAAFGPIPHLEAPTITEDDCG